ncbi:hypothetical protein JAAARDRAFT_38938 [Jaapia argillacea MUCL 33604]|uniref:NADH:flavin oxidoreductase/NADH oxidase N-terminal domain-containing protein n=1 Tax=Jaapia argillacea MUCL 33604 TaxID=933084 RepID=A0A067PGR0_9AGAM|nr:hypothetical protein JAAARDRAFT_38938 [Jaapia argillacea MUCL 33604]
MSSTSALFKPIRLGNLSLSHRVVLAPLTRLRATSAHVPTDLQTEYYKQRASTPGTLLITEATFIAAKAGGLPNVPGIWNDEQVVGWKKVTDAVHSQGSFIFLQLWALGRAANPAVLTAEDPSFPYVSSSPRALSDKPYPPRALTLDEIQEYIQLYATAAGNAVKAGFDGVEIHGANGYLIDQFLQDVVNERTDRYGGSIENRARFGLEVVEAVTKVVGAQRTAIRLSPWEVYQQMRMEDPIPTFSYFVTRLRDLYPELAYIHVTEPRVGAGEDREAQAGESNDFIRDIWSPRPLITAGGYTRDLAIEVADKTGNLVAFGRRFISNPDLPQRLQNGVALTAYNRKTFYSPGVEGYTDYPFASQSGTRGLEEVRAQL